MQQTFDMCTDTSYETTPLGKSLSRDLSSLFNGQTKKGDGLQLNFSTTATTLGAEESGRYREA